MIDVQNSAILGIPETQIVSWDKNEMCSCVLEE